MLFHSYEFIFIFFPLVLIAFFAIGPRHVTAAGGFLALASLFFYAWWSVAALPMLVGSIIGNFLAGRALVPRAGRTAPWRKLLLVASITANLALLSVFKYADFFVSNINSGLALLGLSPLPLLHVVLPVGISFYTFTQIAFLVDCWQGRVNETRFVHYVLFVTYFPHLVAGPVLHHAQMMPQFANPSIYRINHQNLALGITLFTIGLAKKLLIADPLGQAADLVFGQALSANPPAAPTAWMGVLSYTLQIYFD
ncbi:MAG TPA: MBOAT family protein, partial [Burkholderiaceae bacterium]|nr:MBOAT family protein [Burkholderiaceae bacterium]